MSKPDAEAALPPFKPTEASPLMLHEAVPRVLPKEVHALNTIRLLASVHIVAFHDFGCPAATSGPPCNTFSSWGGVWVSFFFFLSGFGTAYSRLLRKEPPSAASWPSRLMPSPRLLAAPPKPPTETSESPKAGPTWSSSSSSLELRTCPASSSYADASAEANVLVLVFRLERDAEAPSILLPTRPISTLARSVTFASTDPMELGCRYGETFWEE